MIFRKENWDCSGSGMPIRKRISRGLQAMRRKHIRYRYLNRDRNVVFISVQDITGQYREEQNQIARLKEAMVLVTKAGTGISDIREIAVKNRSRNYVQMSVSASLHAEFKGYNTTIECLNALKNGRVDGMICGLPSATWLINQNNASAYSIVTISPATLEICAATSYENGTLCSVLSKAVGTSSYSFNEIMDQVSSGRKLIGCIPFPEPAECPVADRLLFKTCCMKCVLKTKIELTLFLDLIICHSGKFLNDEGSDYDIDRRIGAGIRFRAVKGSKYHLVYVGENVIGKSLCPGFLQHECHFCS